jgi:peptidoglycan/xylan/chitin deacetylase (PgdA/CDA1 family)
MNQYVKQVKKGLPYNGLGNVLYPSFLSAQLKNGKGGVIGTAGKGVISLRFDDYEDQFKSTMLPLLTERKLVGSKALISRFTARTGQGDNTTWDDIRSWVTQGIEVWCHSATHLDPMSKGYAGLVDEIVTSKAEILAQNVKPLAWIMPGTSPTTSGLAYGATFATLTDFNSDAGQLIIQNYGAAETDAIGVRRSLPDYSLYGINHETVSDGTMTLVQAKGRVDRAAAYCYGIEFMFHCGNIGKTGNITWAEVTELLDYIASTRDAGFIENLTPTGLIFADSSTDRRTSVISNGDFEKLSTETIHGVNFSDTLGWSSPIADTTIVTTGGHAGNNFARIPNVSSNCLIRTHTNLTMTDYPGNIFILECWCKSSDSSPATAKVELYDTADSTRLNIVKTETVNSEWTRLWFPFGLPVLTDGFTLKISCTSGTGIDVDDVRMLPN